MPKVTKQSVKRKKKSASVIDRIVPMEFDDKIKMNLYGRSGSGKTTLWGSFPKPILAIVCSGPKKSGELRSLNTPENRKSIKQVGLENSEELGELVEYAADSDFQTIVLDHITELQLLILKEILGIDKIPEQLSWGLASRQQYGQCTLQTEERLRSLLNLDKHIVLVAQQRKFESEEDSELDSEPYIGSAVTPSTANWLFPACDYICQTFKRQKTTTKTRTIGGKKISKEVPIPGKVEYCLRTGPDEVYTTKFRLPKGTEIPELIVDPDFEKINALIS